MQTGIDITNITTDIKNGTFAVLFIHKISGRLESFAFTKRSYFLPHGFFAGNFFSKPADIIFYKAGIEKYVRIHALEHLGNNSLLDLLG